MQYLGGKSRGRKQIVELINRVAPGRAFVEPFVGWLNIAPWVNAQSVALSDINKYVIALHRAWRSGWRPGQISKADYNDIKRNRDAYPDHLVGFAGFCLSFAAGYATDRKGQDYRAGAINSLSRKHAALRPDAEFHCMDYREAVAGRTDAVIYCDPPYAGTTGYGMEFDHDCFWRTMGVVVRSNIVLVSEFAAPAGWVPIADIGRQVGLRGRERKQDLVFAHESQVRLFSPTR